MDKWGLNNNTVTLITDLFKLYKKVETVKIFGSRAKGNYKPASDIDLVLFGNIDEKLVRHISSELDELPTPYKFDIISYKSIDNENLKKSIDEYAQIFFQQS